MTDSRSRRHHYVWQHYLAAWETTGTLACLRNNRVFRTRTTNLAVERDFYRLQELTEHDLLLLRALISKATEPLQRLNIGWLPLFVAPFQLKQLASLFAPTSPEIANLLTDMVSNVEEKLHAKTEADSIELLDAARHGDLAFMSDQKQRCDFILYLCMQYFRTAKQRDDLAALSTGYPEINFNAVGGPLRHIFATNVGAGLVGRWSRTEVTLLSAPDGAEFITADQPIINTHAVGKDIAVPVELLAFYYPVSPSVALRWDTEAGRHQIGRRGLSAAEVDSLNRDLFSMANEQVFATRKELLVPYVRG